MHVQAFKLMIFENHFETSLEKYHSFHEKTYIELFIDFFSALRIFLHQFPLNFTANINQKLIEKISNKNKKVEFLRLQFIISLVFIETISHIYFISKFCIHVHKDEKNDKKSKQTTNIR